MPDNKYKALFVCIHNSARSQMAEAFLRQHGGEFFEAESAGLEPGKLNPNVVAVMKEIGIDLTGKATQAVNDLFQQGRQYDAVITVCDKEAAERCPIFPGKVKRIAWSFKDPSAFKGTQEEVLEHTRKVRDEIEVTIKDFIQQHLKDLVRQKYSEIALQDKTTNQSSCCGSGCCSTEVYNIMTDDYSNLEGYDPMADLGLGCGLPTQFAKVKKGDVVVDLGSGAGNDCFIARAETGETGKVIGIDFTPAMIEKARANAEQLGYNNVEFRQGDIEDMPLTGNKADVVVSNCVLNLVPNKHKVFSEISRILKPGGHFSISDIVLKGQLPAKWKEVAELYAGCISGAIQKNEYLSIIEEAGFVNIQIQKEKEIILPDDILSQYLSPEEVAAYKVGDSRIESITVYGEKAAKDERNCCEPGSKCC